MKPQWQGFQASKWCRTINVSDFIKTNYTPYDGDESFLAPATERTKRVLAHFDQLVAEEKERGGVLDIDTKTVSGLNNYAVGVLHPDEIIKGLQTDAPLKRGVNPFGGIRMAKQACEAYGYQLDPELLKRFEYRTTHNDGVFRVYTPEMKRLRKTGIITGLPDAYGRGRIIGDYRRVALYGTARLIEAKQHDFDLLGRRTMTDETIRLREDVARHIVVLDKLAKMGASHGFDLTQPAANAFEAVQWLYLGYLAAIKEQNGAAMSLGRTSTFLDIYIQRDLDLGIIDESQAQEIIDDFVLKLRCVRQLRTPEYNELFAGDPNWVTEAIGGMSVEGQSMVTKNSFRFLNTLYNLGANPEPNLTVLWSPNLPESFRHFCGKVSLDTSSVQYENDELMRPVFGDDYGIACCVSAMKIGKQMQFFGARCNLPKTLLLAINGGRDELNGNPVKIPLLPPLTGVLDFDTVWSKFRETLSWLARVYVNTMNVIHYMHDKYCYEKLEMALHDTSVERLMAFGGAGISVVADSLSAIKYAKVTAVSDDSGLVVDYITEGDFPKYGNDDDRVDSLARDIVEIFYKELKAHHAYRSSKHTLSMLTITSNVVYGKKTGHTPDGRRQGEPFAPGANPMHGREVSGALASLNSVSKLDYDCCRDGISNTCQLVPTSLGSTDDERASNLAAVIDGYFMKGGHHVNINTFTREQLLEAHEHPELYPNLTIRVSGYAVKFTALSKSHREEVLKRTFFESL